MSSKGLPVISEGSGGLSRYLQEIRKFPMLQPDEEYVLEHRK
ncbi:MAG TPA: sigma-70 factor domain-containing protein, partial [Hyphomicrobiaceae bacterium]|nr:sigma-70 factor domain-containing protein [Hyphomicrobiaceae bacterium]